MKHKNLASIHDIKQYFEDTNNMYYFISASNFNLMAMADWVKNWCNINFIDCYDKLNKSVLLPTVNEIPIFKNIEDINNFLLSNEKILHHIENSASDKKTNHAIFLFYDESLEKTIRDLGMNLIMPPNKLVKHIDNKIVTTEIGNSVDVPSVPNALVKIESYSHLRSICKEHKLTDDVVIQTAFGDSGKTTYFISNETQYHSHAEKIESEKQVKVMKRIPCLQVAMEACATKKGTYIGPILTEIIGHPKLTPYKGGWCGNDVNPYIFNQSTQQTMYTYSEKLGHALYKKGYRGYFEVDYLIDVADPNNPHVYLGEINPRVTGISALTNMSAFCQQNIPLFLFHLLEFSDVDFDLKPEDFNRSVQDFRHPAFGQLIFKYTQQTLKIVTAIPNTGVYTYKDNKLTFLRYADNPHQAKLLEDEIFILRMISKDEYVYKGADILILFANHQLQDNKNTLTPAAENFIHIMDQSITYRELTNEEFLLTERYGKRANIKSSANN